FQRRPSPTFDILTPKMEADMRDGARICGHAAVFFAGLALCGCAEQRSLDVPLDLPPVIAESDETPIADNGALVARCLPLARTLASGIQTEVGSPRLTHSRKWGDILRV